MTLPVAEIVAGLNKVQPTELRGYPSILHALTAEAKHGRLHIQPQSVTCTSEPLLPETREAILETWGVAPLNIWGTSESGGTGVSCGIGDGLHIADDLLIFEPVDVNGRPVPPGMPANKVLLTNLYHTAQPLIRYELTDEVTMLRDPCPCGSGHRRVADVMGRADDVFWYGDMLVHPNVFRSELGRHAAIVEYQVRQTHCGADIAVTTAQLIDTGPLASSLAHELQCLGLENATVNVDVVNEIERLGTGKLKRFIPLDSRAPIPD